MTWHCAYWHNYLVLFLLLFLPMLVIFELTHLMRL
ncbi:hypothetical protein ACJIZ3_006348 [Penstemon smallii]|uniref:NADH dehydrogenase subunit 4 n=1 Tax=Penstemon smallii TaxID=265156 RepID=A0ABD3S7L5_9LAMI